MPPRDGWSAGLPLSSTARRARLGALCGSARSSAALYGDL